jgi:hypothetical protein
MRLAICNNTDLIVWLAALGPVERRERVRAAAFGSLSANDQSGCASWQGWWVMSPVITASSLSDSIITLTRRVAGGRREPDLQRDHVVQIHQLDEAGGEDRLDAIAEHRLLLLLVIVGAPEVVLAPTDEVARLRESGHPPAVLERRAHASSLKVRPDGDESSEFRRTGQRLFVTRIAELRCEPSQIHLSKRNARLRRTRS